MSYELVNYELFRNASQNYGLWTNAVFLRVSSQRVHRVCHPDVKHSLRKQHLTVDHRPMLFP